MNRCEVRHEDLLFFLRKQSVREPLYCSAIHEVASDQRAISAYCDATRRVQKIAAESGVDHALLVKSAKQTVQAYSEVSDLKRIAAWSSASNAKGAAFKRQAIGLAATGFSSAFVGVDGNSSMQAQHFAAGMSAVNTAVDGYAALRKVGRPTNLMTLARGATKVANVKRAVLLGGVEFGITKLGMSLDANDPNQRVMKLGTIGLTFAMGAGVALFVGGGWFLVSAAIVLELTSAYFDVAEILDSPTHPGTPATVSISNLR